MNGFDPTIDKGAAFSFLILGLLCFVISDKVTIWSHDLKFCLWSEVCFFVCLFAFVCFSV